MVMYCIELYENTAERQLTLQISEAGSFGVPAPSSS